MYQKLIIIGNLGRDPEMQYTQAGLEVTKCSGACKAGKDKTIWIGGSHARPKGITRDMTNQNNHIYRSKNDTQR